MAPPPKTKLHNKTGKLKKIGSSQTRSINTVTNNNVSNSETPHSASGSNSVGDSIADCQFELELCWCVQQLQTSLDSGKLNEKQVQTTQKTLNILISPNQPMIKKRQLMRTTFGDYRAKMTEEEKKLSLGTKHIKFDVNQKQKENAYFIKKSVFLKPPDKNFKFNFEITQGMEELKLSKDGTGENDKPLEEKSDVVADVEKSNFMFTPSENNFKFNFNI